MKNNRPLLSRTSLFVCLGLFAALAISRADTTITNTTTTETYTTANHASKNLGNINANGTGTLVLSSTSNTNFSDSSTSFNASNGGAETVDLTNSGSGTFTFNLGTIGRTAPSTINFETSTTGGAVSLTTSTQIAHGTGAGSSIVTGDDLTFWAFYNGNDWAATPVGGGAIGSAASEYNDGGHDTSATNLSTWNTNAYEDYTDDTTTAYSGSLSASALKHGIRFANSAGANFDLGGFTLTVAGLLDAQGAGAVTIGNGKMESATTSMVVNQNNLLNKMTISANIIDNGGSDIFQKVGVGTLVLTGANNAYTGATYISQGTLQLDGNLLHTSKVILNSGATLSGIGTINAAVTAGDASSVISVGDPGQIGTLNLNALTATSGLTLNFTLDGDGNTFGTDNDFIDVGGLSLGGTVNVNITTLDSLMTDTPYLLMAGNVWSGSPTFDFTTPEGYKVESYDYDTTFNEFTVEFEAVPEPSIFAMLLGGAGILGLVLRRKRAQL